jgi:uncharacterized protein (TIRG00374 family)
MTKAALRAIVLICLGVGILFFMHREGLFDLSAVASAFAQQLPLVVVIVLSQILLAGLLLLRYGLLVRMLGLTLPWSHLASANFVSNAVGQWAPGSLAVTEILRMSLMLGAQKAQGNSLSKSASAIAVASFYDRTIGFFTMLSVGSVTTLIALWQGVRSQALVPSFQNASFVGLGALFVFSFFSSLGLLFLPFLARSKRMKIFAEFLQKKFPAHHALGKILARFLNVLEVLRQGERVLHHMFLPFLISALCLFLSCFGLYLCAHAVGGQLEFGAILATFPMTALASLLPLGFAGLGGYQLVAVGAFGLFGVAPAVVSTASVLQNALLLAVNTLIGVLYAHHSSKSIAAALKNLRERA